MERSLDPATKFYLEELKIPESADRRLQNATKLYFNPDRSSSLVSEILELYKSETDPRVLSIYRSLLHEIDNFTPEQILEIINREIRSTAWIQLASEIVQKQADFHANEMSDIFDSLGLLCFRQNSLKAQAYALKVLYNFAESLSPQVLGVAAFALALDSSEAKRYALEIIASTQANFRGLIPALFYEYQLGRTHEVQAEFAILIKQAAPEVDQLLSRIICFCNEASKSSKARFDYHIPAGFEEIFHFAAKPFVDRQGYNEEFDPSKISNICELSHLHWFGLRDLGDEEDALERIELLANASTYADYSLELFRSIIDDCHRFPEQLVFEAAIGMLRLGVEDLNDLDACCAIVLSFLFDSDLVTAEKARFNARCFFGSKLGNLRLRATEMMTDFFVNDEVSDSEKCKTIRSWGVHENDTASRTESYLQLLAPIALNKYKIYSADLQLEALRFLVRSQFVHFDSETKESFTLLLADLATAPEATIELRQLHRYCEKRCF